MSLIILIKPTRSKYILLPFKNGSNTAIFKGVLILQHTSKGPRPFKFRIIDGKAEDVRTPGEAIDLLRIADLILIARYGDEASQRNIQMMLDGYQLPFKTIDVCRICVNEGRFSPVDSSCIRYKDEFICDNCGLSELHREISLSHKKLTEEGIERLFNQLLKTRDMNRMLMLLDPKKMDRELTLFDRVQASRFEKITKVRDLNINGRLKKVLPGSLLPVQSIAISSGLLEGTNQLVVSATATGKTLVGEICGIENILRNRGKMLFMVPLVALANQKYDQFTNKYGKLGLTTAIKVGKGRIKKGKHTRMRTSLNSDIIVGTYEGLDHLMRLGGIRRLGKVGTIVIDEVHMIEDHDRGPRLDGLISRLRFFYPKCQFIYLSATVGNPKWLGDSLGTVLVEYEERPVPLERHLIFGGPSEKLRLIDLFAKEEYNRKSSKGFRGQTMVFTNSRRNCHKISESLKIPAAAYHAGLPYKQRRKIEEDFGNGRVPVIVTTAALAAGVDFPASQVIFESLAMGIEWITQGEFLQMQGRAGRPDYHDRGMVVLIAEPDNQIQHGESEDHVAFRLLRGEVPPITVESDEDSGLEQVLASCALWNDKHILKSVESLRLGGGDVDYLLHRLHDLECVKINNNKIWLTKMGRIMITHFLSLQQMSTIKDGICSGLEPVDILVSLEVFDQAFFAGADRIAASLNVRLPSRVFQGAAMEMALSGESLARLDNATRQKLINFASEFLSCECKYTPYCGCPEKKFSKKLFDLRHEGLSPGRMIDALTAQYGVFAYPSDLLEYLESSVRHLEAVVEVAYVQGDEISGEKAGKLLKYLVG
jgi:helicase